MKKFIPILFLVSLLISCTKQKLDPAEYVQWNDSAENGLIKSINSGSQVLSCQYTPNQYVVLKSKVPENIVKNEFLEEVLALEELIQFKLKFQNQESGSFLKDNYTTIEEYNRRTMYMSFDIRIDLRLVQDQDTVFCNMNHHERTYGNTPYETVLISFPKIKEFKSLELIFDDRVFGFGRVKFYFSEETLAEIPELEI